MRVWMRYSASPCSRLYTSSEKQTNKKKNIITDLIFTVYQIKEFSLSDTRDVEITI